MLRREFITFTAGGVALLAGCETVETAQTPDALASAQQEPDRSTVIGRLQWIENGKEREIEQSMLGWSISPRLKRLEDRRIMHATIDPGGHFLWSLPAGTYMIDRLNYRDPWTGNYFVAPKFAFKVPRAGRSYYVGTLRIDAASRRGFLGALDGEVNYSVLDNYAKEMAYLRRNLGTDTGRVEKSLMVWDDRLPQSVDTTTQAQLALTLLGALF